MKSYLLNFTRYLSSIDSAYLRLIFDTSILLYFTTILTLYNFINYNYINYQILFFLPSFILLNYFFGTYNTQKKYSILKKVLFILLSIIASFFLISYNINSNSFIFSSTNTIFILYLIPILVFPRILLGMHYGPNKKILNLISKEKGPILIVGGAGYIGSCLVDLLLENNLRVRVLDKLMYGKESLEKHFNNSNFELIEGDATNITILTESMADVSAVIHLAGLVGDPACSVNEKYTRHTNIISTRIIRDLVIALEVPRMIFASSCSVYGSSDTKVSEESDLNPVSLYAQTKIDSEKELLSFVPDNLSLTCLRFATVFGHSERPRFDLVTNLFCAAALQEGKFKIIGPNQYRPFIHVKDLARSVMLTLLADKQIVRNQIFNVGDESMNITIGDLGKKVHNHALNFNNRVIMEIIDNPDDKRNYIVSFDKIKKYLNFSAKYSLDEGIIEMLEKINSNDFENYKSDKYNNVFVTKKQIDNFENSKPEDNLYTSLST